MLVFREFNAPTAAPKPPKVSIEPAPAKLNALMAPPAVKPGKEEAPVKK